MANPYSKSRFPLPSGMQTQASEAWNQQALDMLEARRGTGFSMAANPLPHSCMSSSHLLQARTLPELPLKQPTWHQAQISHLTELQVEGLKVKYIGPGEDDSQAAAIMTNNPVPPDCPLYYFEVGLSKIGESGRRHSRVLCI